MLYINLIRGFFKSVKDKILLMPRKYRAMKQKAENYDKIMSTIQYSAHPIFNEIEDGLGNILCKTVRCVKKDVYIDVSKLLKSGGFDFTNDVEIHIVD